MFADNFLLLINNPVAIAIILIFLNFSSYTDIKWLKIYDKSTIAFLIIRIILIFIPQYNLPFTLMHLLGGIFGFLILLIPAMIFLLPMGGDIKLMAVLGLYLGFPAMLSFLFILCASSLVYFIINKVFIFIKNKLKRIITNTTELDKFDEKDKNLCTINENTEGTEYTDERKKKVSKGLLIPLAPFFTLSFVILIVFATKILSLF